MSKPDMYMTAMAIEGMLRDNQEAHRATPKAMTFTFAEWEGIAEALRSLEAVGPSADCEETVSQNPKSWIAWKRKAEEHERDAARLDDMERTRCYPFWNGNGWTYIVAPERSSKVERKGMGATVREAIDDAMHCSALVQSEKGRR